MKTGKLAIDENECPLPAANCNSTVVQGAMKGNDMSKTNSPNQVNSPTASTSETPIPDALPVVINQEEDSELDEARTLIGPAVSNAFALQQFCQGTLGNMQLENLLGAMVESSNRVNANDLRDIEATLSSQAILLNTMFGELTCRAAFNLNGGGGFKTETELYLKMALKVQNQCRMTLETLSTIKNPPAIYAKQANISNGPQQVNNGTAACEHGANSANPPNKLLELDNDKAMDIRTAGQTIGGNTELEAVAKLNRAEVAARQNQSFAKRI